MADIVTPNVRSRMMAGIKHKDTKPEIVVRRLLHSSGYRFRLHQKNLPGRPDLVLKRFNAAIFVNGCFWHGHADCHLFRLPKTRQNFWSEKISGNQQRDHKKQSELLALGWRVAVVWECAMKGKVKLDPAVFLTNLENFICGDTRFIEIYGRRVNE